MDRRKFLNRLFGVAGAVAAAAMTGGKVEAASLFDDLKVEESCGDASEATADLPAEQASEAQFYYVQPRRRAVRRRSARRPVVRRVVRQRCWYVRDRFGRLIRRCGYV